MFLTRTHFSYTGRLGGILLLAGLLILAPDRGLANCSSCESGGEGSGGGGAEFLFGLAAIIAAVSPMVAAAVQADADKQIAKTNADAQVTMTKISADTSRKLADQQKDIAFQQAETAKEISEKNQSAVTERLAIQLNELRSAREEASAIEEKKRQYQQELDAQRIQLAQKQAEETQKLASTQLRAQLTAAGLSQGFTRSQDSSTGVPLTRTIAPNTTALSSVASARSSASLGLASMPSRAAAVPVRGVAQTVNTTTQSPRGVSGLASRISGEEREPPVPTKQALQKNKSAKAVQALARGVAKAASWVSSALSAGPALSETLRKNIAVRGSTKRDRLVMEAVTGTGRDLTNFARLSSRRNSGGTRHRGFTGPSERKTGEGHNPVVGAVGP